VAPESPLFVIWKNLLCEMLTGNKSFPGVGEQALGIRWGLLIPFEICQRAGLSVASAEQLVNIQAILTAKLPVSTPVSSVPGQAAG
jgi:hypothetical protein